MHDAGERGLVVVRAPARAEWERRAAGADGGAARGARTRRRRAASDRDGGEDSAASAAPSAARAAHSAGSFVYPGNVQLRSSFSTASCVESRWSGVTATSPSISTPLQSEPGMSSFVAPPSPPIQ